MIRSKVFVAASVAAAALWAASESAADTSGVFAIPVGATVSFSEATLGACNNLNWGIQLNGDGNQVQGRYANPTCNSSRRTDPTVTVGPLSVARTVRVFLTDEACTITYYSDGTPVDHVTITGPQPASPETYFVKFSDGGPGCQLRNTVTSNAGTGNLELSVVVRDVAVPSIAVPSDITVDATSKSGALVSYTASAADNFDGATPVSCAPTSGSAFPVGPTTVNCTAQDKAGNSAKKTFVVTVRDAAAPSITVPADMTVDATGSAGAQVSYNVAGSDVIDGSTPVTCVPGSGSTFPPGTTSVTCTAKDRAGNSAQAKFTVTVKALPGGGGGPDLGKDVVVPAVVTKPKKPPKPPPPPKSAKYGVVVRVQTTRIKNGLQAKFFFRKQPVVGATLRVVWYYNNKRVGVAAKKRAAVVTSFVRGSSLLPKGYWRCALTVKPPKSGWKTVKEAQLRINKS